MVECDSLPMDQLLESTQIAVEALVVVLLCNCREVVHSPFLRDSAIQVCPSRWSTR
jgi:hypothetical protein